MSLILRIKFTGLKSMENIMDYVKENLIVSINDDYDQSLYKEDCECGICINKI